MAKDLNSWQRDMMDESSENPPENIFDSINNELNNDFDQWQSEEFKGNDQTPPDDVWDNIAFNLDSNANWTAIRNNLRNDRRKYWFKRTAALLLLLLGLGYTGTKTKLFNSYNESQIAELKETPTKSDLETTDTENANEKPNVSGENTTVTSDISNDERNNNKLPKDENNTLPETGINGQDKGTQKSNNSVQVNTTINIILPNKTNDSIYSINNRPETIITNSKTEDYLEDKTTIHQVRLDSIINRFTVEKMILLSVSALASNSNESINCNEEVDDTESSSFLNGRSYIGLTGAINNNWLLNPETFEGLSTTSSSDSKLSVGSSYGIVFGYDIDNKNVIEIVGVFNESVNQRYSFYSEGKYHNQEIKFDITKLSISAKRKGDIRNKGNIAFMTSTVYGIYFGKIKHVGTEIDGTLLFSSYDYEKYNYGIMVGKDVELFINSSFSFITGIKFNIDANNVFKGTQALPASFNTTHITSLGINTALIYHIR